MRGMNQRGVSKTLLPDDSLQGAQDGLERHLFTSVHLGSEPGSLNSHKWWSAG